MEGESIAGDAFFQAGEGRKKRRNGGRNLQFAKERALLSVGEWPRELENVG